MEFICHTQTYKNNNFQIDGASRYFDLLSPKTGPLTKFGLLFPVVCFVFVSGQALEELSYP